MRSDKIDYSEYLDVDSTIESINTNPDFNKLLDFCEKIQEELDD